MNFTCVKSRHKVVILPIFWGAHQRHEGYLQGDQLIVSWCIGHLLEMLPPDAYDAKYKRWSLTDLPILPQQWGLYRLIYARA